MFSPASGVYFPGKVWGDSEVSGLKALKGKYAITDLALGTYGGLGKYYWVYEDMIAAGFAFADVATAVVKIGGREGMIAVAGMMADQHASAKQIAATLVVICLNESDISMSLNDVAYSLLVYGPNARSYGYSWSPNYSWYDLFQAVYVASAAFIQATGADAYEIPLHCTFYI